MEKQKFLAHLRGTAEMEIGQAVIEAAELALQGNNVQVTRFYDPEEQRVAKSVLSMIPEINVLALGGYRNAERCRLAVMPRLYLVEMVKPPVTALQAKSTLDCTGLTFQVYRESLAELGIKQGQIGDLFLQAKGCQVIVAREIAELVSAKWLQVQGIPIITEEIDPLQLDIEPERVKDIKTTVASMRLDSIAAAGFGISRSKMAREIKNQRIMVNWKIAHNPAYLVTVGDIVAISGRGRVVVKEITGKTKKGRIGMVLQRLIY